MYYLRWTGLSGPQQRGIVSEDEALAEYERYAEVYKYVTLNLEEVVTTETIVRDSSQEA